MGWRNEYHQKVKSTQAHHAFSSVVTCTSVVLWYKAVSEISASRGAIWLPKHFVLHLRNQTDINIMTPDHISPRHLKTQQYVTVSR